MTDEPFEVAIIGAGPAGTTATILLARRGRRVALIDRRTFPRNVPTTAWLNAASEPLLSDLGLDLSTLREGAFEDVAFYRADFEKCARPSFSRPPGFLIDRVELNNALVARTTDRRLRRGRPVTLLQGVEVRDVKLRERGVALELPDGRRLEASLLLFAAGRGSPLFDRLGVPETRRGARVWTAQVETGVDKPRASRGGPRIAVIVGLDERGSFGLCCVGRGRVSVAVSWQGDKDMTIPMLSRLCAQAFEHRVVPADLSGQARRAPVIEMLASAALEMDSHVGKHTLLIGEAGGFVAAASNEGLYPAMWSAQIAADVVEEALESEHSQDELIAFNSLWRVRMADYLRPPHSDLEFLLPMVFTNQSMADRMGAAFFSGENI